MMPIAKIRSKISEHRFGRWIGYFASSCISVTLVFVLFKTDPKLGLLIAAFCIALIMLFLCFYRLEIGIYGMLIFSFLSSFFTRILDGNLPLTTILMLLPFILLGILIAKNLISRDKRWFILHPIFLIYLVIVGYTVAEAFNPNMDSFLGWLSYFRGILMSVTVLILFLYLFKDIKSIRFFFKFILGIFFITGLYGCIQQYFGLTPFETRWLYRMPGALGLFSLPGQGIRKFSFLTDPANFGTLMATAAMGTLVMISGPFKRSEKGVLVFFTLVIILGMSFSGTRTANIMLVAGIALYVIMTIYKKTTWRLAVASLVVFLLILYAPIYGNVTINRIRSAFNSPHNDASFDLRSIHRHEMQPFIHSHPFGNGVNTTMGAGAKYNPHNFLAGFPPDSIYFHIALEQGWVGLFLFCVFLFSVLVFSAHYFYKCNNVEIKTYYLSLTTMLFTMMLGAYTQFTFSSIPQNFIFMAFISCIIKLHTFDTSKHLEIKFIN